MSMIPRPISLPPGVVATPTKATDSANWSETNLMRWVQNRIQPFGGWSKQALGGVLFASPVMAIHKWTTLGGVNCTAYLCSAHLYVDLGDGPTDVSPVVPIVPPSNDFVAGGYGDNIYNYGSYGTPRPAKDITTIVPSMYTIDNWGEDLIVMTSNDGRLLRWKSATPSVKAVVVPNSPVGRTFVVTPQRHVIVFGAEQFNRLKWCDEENIENWTAGVASKAGDYDLQPMSPIVTACIAGSDVIAFTANNNGFTIQYIGLPYIYRVVQFQSNTVPMSPDAIIDTPNGCVWASQDGFWAYTAGQAVALPCTVWDWVKTLIDTDLARRMATFVILPTFSEILFFFPSVGSNINDRYVLWNFKDQWWANGKMKRTCGVKSTYVGYPVLSDGTFIYQHESGTVYNLQAGEELPWAKTHNLNFSGGAQLMTVQRMLPDIGSDVAGLSFQLEYNIDRNGPQTMLSDQLSIIDGAVGFRDTGRDFRIIVTQTVNAVKKWTWGNTLIETYPRGRT